MRHVVAKRYSATTSQCYICLHKIDGNFWWYWRFCCQICAGIKPWLKMLFKSAIWAMVSASIASLLKMTAKVRVAGKFCGVDTFNTWYYKNFTLNRCVLWHRYLPKTKIIYIRFRFHVYHLRTPSKSAERRTTKVPRAVRMPADYYAFDFNSPIPNWGSLYLGIARFKFHFSCLRLVLW